MAFINSPLFQEASRQVRQMAMRQLRESTFGRLVSEVETAVRQSQRPQEQVRRAMRRFSSAARPDNAIRELMGTNFGGLVREIQRYSKHNSASEKLVAEFLDTLGPAGHLIRGLIDPAKTSTINRELQAAMNVIRAFGGEVLPGTRWATVGDVERGLQAALQRLQEYGFEVVGSKGPPRRSPEPDEGRKTIDVEMGYRRGTRRVPADHPMLTGDMVEASASTNVYEFGYDIDAGYLYVRFQNPHPAGSRGSPGPLYKYSGVTPDEFLSLYRLRNSGGGDGPGAWVWDVLRIRGTVSGHHKDYELVGVMDREIVRGGKTVGTQKNYVPRKATVRPTYEYVGKRGQPLKKPRKTGVEEWYEQREVKTHQGRWVRSVLPTARVVSARR